MRRQSSLTDEQHESGTAMLTAIEAPTSTGVSAFVESTASTINVIVKASTTHSACALQGGYRYALGPYGGAAG